MLINDTHLNMINSPVRSFQGKVECYDSTNALVATYTHLDDLKSYQVERVGEGKFFGYGYVQKINIKLLDTKREKSFTTSNKFRVYIGVDNNYVSTFPMFKITETNRDEKTNALSITAYDALKAAADNIYLYVPIDDYFDADGQITLEKLAIACASHIGIQSVSFEVLNGDMLAQTLYTKELLNLNGNETIRDIFNWIAEVTHTIYFLDASGTLIFRMLDRDGGAGYTITKERYVELDSNDNRRLAKITKATSLGDNVHIALAQTGTNQICMDNPFYELRDDVADLLAPAADTMLGLTVNQFECEWRGNYLLEIGDKIALECKDGSLAYSYLLDDTFLFNGGIEQESQWKWDDTQSEDENNSAPRTLGEVLNWTTARVDKVEQEIVLSIKNAEDAVTKSAELEMTLDGIALEVAELSEKANLTMTKDEVEIAIESAVSEFDNTKIVTKTGYKFDEDGLEITKTDAEMSTVITEDGMTIFRSNRAVLTATNEGVTAEDLHATTYLIVGKNSRFEDYRSNRTGCFWVGEWEEAE